MIPIKLFFKEIIILTVVIGCPIIISVYIKLFMLFMLTLMIPIITGPLTLKYWIGPQNKRYLESLEKHQMTGS